MEDVLQERLRCFLASPTSERLIKAWGIWPPPPLRSLSSLQVKRAMQARRSGMPSAR